MESGFGCIAVIGVLFLVLLIPIIFLKARRGSRTSPPIRGPWSCAGCGASNPDRVHPCPHCGHGHA